MLEEVWGCEEVWGVSAGKCWVRCVEGGVGEVSGD